MNRKIEIRSLSSWTLHNQNTVVEYTLTGLTYYGNINVFLFSNIHVNIKLIIINLARLIDINDKYYEGISYFFII